MTGMAFSEKQRGVWRDTINEHHRWNFSVGATRSGKTYLDYFKIPYRITHARDDGLILLMGNTKGTLERNILSPMRKIYTSSLVGQIGSNNKVRLFGRECWALGADKITQVSKIRGSGYSYIYGDEIPTWAQDVFDMLKSRLDKPGACCDGTGNPERPTHWFKKFLDSNADMSTTGFIIDDNPFLDPRFVLELKKEYYGTVYYDRLILGKWAVAEGAVYPKFANSPKQFIVDDAGKVAFSTIGVDFGGNKSAQAFQCTGFRPGLRGMITLDEYYSKKPLDPVQLENDFVSFVMKQMSTDIPIIEILCDSAEPVLMRGLRNALIKNGIGIPVVNAIKGPILDRVRLYCAMMGSGKYEVMSHCVHTIEAFSEAVWSQTAMGDVRLDDGSSNIDTLDAQEYSSERYHSRLMDAMILDAMSAGSKTA